MLVDLAVAGVQWRERIILAHIHLNSYAWATMVETTQIQNLDNVRGLRLFKCPPRLVPQDLPPGIQDAD